MRRVVIDTNVLVRAFLKKTGNDWRVYEKFLEGEIELYYSQGIIDEFLKVISYPRIKKRIKIENETIEVFLGSLFEEGVLKEPEEINICRDVRDNHIIGLAKRAAKRGKVHLVTSDKDILDLKGKIEGVEIVRPGEFLKQNS